MNTNIYNKNKITKTRQNRLKEFIILLIAIYTNEIVLFFIFIYKEELRNL